MVYVIVICYSLEEFPGGPCRGDRCPGVVGAVWMAVSSGLD